ncbi:hypothetical protein [Streptomyces griseofuscus]|uniref:Uncharacterized protein n=1 Tax=Streptomyces griseofuscus TaxID=146922 RepID=A0A7H1Q3G3_9ACTN|nr:hypothetical protein [Streptomyces griseofuscus]QNT94843.1 hypothetical protein HEP81_04570 [Streptomyces griseofuscus]
MTRSRAPRPRKDAPRKPNGLDHLAVAADAQTHPGQWLHCNDYRTGQAAEHVVRMIRDGRIRSYQPQAAYETYAAHLAGGNAAVWVRYIIGVETKPMPESLWVRVPDYGSQPGYSGVRIRAVEIYPYCPACGGPRGELRNDRFVRDGVHLVRDAWDNACGHRDTYPGVIAEAHRLSTRRAAGDGRKSLRGVPGGRYEAAVNLLARAVEENVRVSAHTAVELLEEAGHKAAAVEVAAFHRVLMGRSNVSARSALLYLNSQDEEALKTGRAGAWVDGPIRPGNHERGRRR